MQHFDNLQNLNNINISTKITNLITIVTILFISGLTDFKCDINKMLGHTPNIYWRVCWKIISPAFLFVSNQNFNCISWSINVDKKILVAFSLFKVFVFMFVRLLWYSR